MAEKNSEEFKDCLSLWKIYHHTTERVNKRKTFDDLLTVQTKNNLIMKGFRHSDIIDKYNPNHWQNHYSDKRTAERMFKQ